MGITLAVSLSAAAVAQAAEPEKQAPKMVVRYADLDLTRPPDARRLYRRIQAAAHLVCEQSRPPVTFGGMAPYYACIDQAVTRAVEQVGSEQVTRLYEADNQHRMARSGVNPGA